MRALDLGMISTEDGKPQDFQLLVERRRGDTWNLEDSIAVTSGTKDATRRVMLDDDMRIVIEPRGAQVEMVMDLANNAVMPRAALESQPDQAAKEKIEADRQAELRDGQRVGARIGRLGDAAAEQARDKVIQEQQEKSREAAAASNEKRADTQNPGSDAPNKSPSPATSTSEGSPQSLAASRQNPPTGAVKNDAAKPGGLTAPGPSTGGQSSKDVKNGQ